MADKIVNHFVLADGYVARYDYDGLLNAPERYPATDYDYTDVDLPIEFIDSTVVEVTASSETPVFYGTHNVAELLGMKQGTFTHNGVTFAVTGNTVSITGTATGQIYYSFADGEIKTGALIGAMSLPLPEISGNYTLSQKLSSGTNVPALCIRAKSSGNVVAVQNSVGTFAMDNTTCGGLYTYIPNGKVCDWTYTVGLFPYETTSSDTHRDELSEVETISADGFYTINGYTWGFGSLQKITKKENTGKKCMLKYSTRSVPSYTKATEVIDVYLPQKVGYTQVVFAHCVDDTTNYYDVWKIMQWLAVDDNYSQRFKITQYGETEMALKINGRDDFIGGHSHGDEILETNGFTAIVDGGVVNIASLTDLTNFDNLRLVETTVLYDPNDHETVVGYHGREYIITSDGIDLLQSVRWANAYTLDASYMPMVCAVRGNDSAESMQITDTYVDNRTFEKWDVSTSGFTTYPRQLKTNATEIMLTGTESGVCVVCEIVKQPTLAGQNSFLANADAYNKIYNAICGSDTQYTTTANELWQTRTIIKVEIGK